MKRFAILVAAVAFMAAMWTPRSVQAGNDDVAAIILSSSLPGVGEWYRAGFSGGFPLIECIVGMICPCVHVASIIDAAAGD